MHLELHRPLVFFDLETTGLDTRNDRIVEIGMVKLHPDGRRDTLVERVDPGVDIPEVATRVHGIRTEDVRGLFGKPRLGRIAARLLEFLGDADLGGFNAMDYDLPLWLAECARHQIEFSAVGRCMVDAKVVFHAKETSWDRFLMGPRDLSAALRFYCGRELRGAHSASADVEATLDVLLAQLQRYPDLPRNVQGLDQWCRNAQSRSSGTAARA
ncbi:MAG: 3'-5' exonuclease [Planctomycetes bacterium]|nr:3'-5' exonuclease [Planctomycetota bacterium]